jgi:hypothetical protein
MKLLKVLNAGMVSPFKNFQYEPNKWYHCEDFDTDLKTDCSRGFYAIDVEGLPYAYHPGKEIWWCEVAGKSVEIDIYKRRYEKIKLTHKVDLNEIKQLAKDKEKTCGYKLFELLFPFNPLTVYTEEEAKEIIVTPLTIERLHEWQYVSKDFRDFARNSVGAFIWYSVGNCFGSSVRDFIWDSVWAFVWAPVWDSIFWYSVRNSIEDSVGAYISSLFPGIEKCDGIVAHKPGVNPFQSSVDLWRSGFVPSFDGKTWKLHAGPKAKVVYEE